MNDKSTYYDVIENDFQCLQATRSLNLVSNMICSSSHSICERYLKYAIDKVYPDIDLYRGSPSVMKTHSLRRIRDFIKAEVPDFSADWSRIIRLDRYYSHTTYPEDGALIVNEDDVKYCYDAMDETRSSVLSFLQKFNNKETENSEHEENDSLGE